MTGNCDRTTKVLCGCIGNFSTTTQYTVGLVGGGGNPPPG